MTDTVRRIKKNVARKQKVRVCLSTGEYVTVIVLGIILGQVIRLLMG